jgi:hypothetical protein
MNVQKLAIPFNKNEKDCIYCLEGGRLRPFHLLPIKRIIKNPQSTKKIEKYEKGMIIGQLANAHVKNPKPHYKLAFCFSPKSSKFISFDTVINISHSLTDYNSELLNSYIICYLNSNVFAWYLYKIVYAGAIRSTRLDYEYLKQVPFIPLNEISGNLFILWFFLAKSLEYLAYGQINLKNSSKDINFTQNQLKKIMNIGIFLLFLSKQDLDTRMDSFQINWQELEILSKKLNEIIDLELISMITKQRNQFTKEFNIYKKKIAHCSQTLWNGGFHELFKIIKEKIEWNLINIPDY